MDWEQSVATEDDIPSLTLTSVAQGSVLGPSLFYSK